MGRIRPFKPGEYIDNGDGTFSTERTVTIEDGQGGWVNVPSLWVGNNGVLDFGEDEDRIRQALSLYEYGEGPKFPRFKSVDEAVSSARSRSEHGGAFSGSGKDMPKVRGLLGDHLQAPKMGGLLGGFKILP